MESPYNLCMKMCYDHTDSAKLPDCVQQLSGTIEFIVMEIMDINVPLSCVIAD